MQEIFKDIIGYEGFYQVSNYGKIKSLYRKLERKNNRPITIKERIIKPYITKSSHISKGYHYITLRKNNISKKCPVHRLVAVTFIDNYENKLCVNHKDHDTLNNSIDNLEWVSNAENSRFSIKSTTRKYSSNYKGVSWDKFKNKWLATITFNYKQMFVGYFKNEIDAAKAYNEAAKKHYKNFAILNKIPLDKVI